jgi:hypothetical protein
MPRLKEGENPSLDAELERAVQYVFNLSPEKTVEFFRRGYHEWHDRAIRERKKGDSHLADRMQDVHTNHVRTMADSWQRTIDSRSKK